MPCVAPARAKRATFPVPPGSFTPAGGQANVPPFWDPIQNDPCGKDVYAGGLCRLHYQQQGGLIAAGQGPNLIANSDFEVNTSGWSAAVGATLSRATAEQHSGVASLKVDCVAQYSGVSVPGSFPAPGTEVRASVWVKAPAGATLYAQVNDGAAADTAYFTGTGSWQNVTVRHVLSAGASQNALLLGVDPGQTISFYVDDADLRVWP